MHAHRIGDFPRGHRLQMRRAMLKEITLPRNDLLRERIFITSSLLTVDREPRVRLVNMFGQTDLIRQNQRLNLRFGAESGWNLRDLPIQVQLRRRTMLKSPHSGFL
jgi:hypothetical protein